SEDLAAIGTAGLRGLSAAQITAMDTVQLTGLGTAQMAALTSAQVAGLTTEQMANFATDDLRALSSSAIGSLSTTQFEALDSVQISVLSSAQMRAMTTSQLHTLTTEEINALGSAQIAALSSAQLGSLGTEQFSAFQSQDIKAFVSSQMAGLTTEQIHSITSDQVKGFDTEDLAKLNMNQVVAFTTEALSAMTASQLDGLYLATPIMLDLNGNGVQTLSAEQGVSFDLNGTGAAHKYGWATGGDGLLAMDRNGDGVINSGAELFGSGTILASGKHAANGYLAMAAEDSNHDGKLDAHDANFNKLRVWVDANHDGKTDTGELKTLADMGITELDLQAKSSTAVDHGNLIGLVSGYKTADGGTHQMADVWFAKDVSPNGEPSKASPALTDLLAAPSENLLVQDDGKHIAPSMGDKPSELHHALLERKLIEDEENHRLNGPLL
ncbi:heme utilization protein, partial [Paucibacter sp. hw8]|nr:heme utilization protein [Roseateles albus]